MSVPRTRGRRPVRGGSAAEAAALGSRRTREPPDMTAGEFQGRMQ